MIRASNVRARGIVRLISSAKDVPFKGEYLPWINGAERAPSDISSAKTLELKSPASQEYLCRVVCATEKQTNEAIELGNSVFENGVWAKADVRVRAKVLNSIAEELRKELPRLVPMEVAQTGRAIREMRAQLGRLPEWFEYFSALIRTQEGTVPPFLGNYVNYVRRMPLGVCGLLTPWNHPLLIAVKKLAPALAAGNSVILKPSELAPVTVLELGEICRRAQLPDGVLNILPGLGEPVGRAICSHPHMRKIDLTGGTSTGRVVGSQAGANLCGLLTELGGKAPMIIFPDADLDQAVNGAAFATFVASGQTCIMGARLVIHESVYDQFMEKLAAKAKKIRLGNPFADTTQMGPVISQNSHSRITRMVGDAVKAGAKVYSGAQPYPVAGTKYDNDSLQQLAAPYNQGYYYPPTVLGVQTNMEIWREEVFGPVVVAKSFKTEAEAIALANDSPYGLAAAVWTKDIMRAHRVAEHLHVGIIWLNDHHRNDPSSPWGGTKDSGVGRENGLFALHEYSQTKSVVVRTEDTPFDWFEQPQARYS